MEKTNINEQLFAKYNGGGYGWHPLIAGYFMTSGAQEAMKEYRLSEVFINLIEMHVASHAESTAVAKILVAESRISILLNYFENGEEKNMHKVLPTMLTDNLLLTLYVGTDNVICLPCED